MKTILLTVAAALTMVASAFAMKVVQPTTERAMNFAESIADATVLAESFKERGLADLFDSEELSIVDGEFKPYTGALIKMEKDHPQEFKEVDAMARKHHFKNAYDWAGAGNWTMLTYMSEKLPKETAHMMERVSPEMFPEDVRSQYEKAMAVLKAIQAVSDEDRAILAPAMAKLEAAIAQSAHLSGAFDGMPTMGK